MELTEDQQKKKDEWLAAEATAARLKAEMLAMTTIAFVGFVDSDGKGVVIPLSTESELNPTDTFSCDMSDPHLLIISIGNEYDEWVDTEVDANDPFELEILWGGGEYRLYKIASTREVVEAWLKTRITTA